MANIIDNMDAIEEEIRELILHSKSKRRMHFEPCTEENLPKYLKAVEEEMSLHCIKYLFNPYEDLEPNKIKGTLVRVVNATWELLLLHKDVSNNGQKLKERNYSLQQNNFHLNKLTEKQKNDLKRLDGRVRQVEEEKRQLVVKMSDSNRSAAGAEGEVRKYKVRLANREQELLTQLRKAQRENEAMRDRFHAGIFTSRAEARDSTIEEYRARERRYKESIARLQENNRQLIQEVLSLKEDLIHGEDDGAEECTRR